MPAKNDLLFVTTVGVYPQPDENAMTSIRKHVMRDIGLTRRNRKLSSTQHAYHAKDQDPEHKRDQKHQSKHENLPAVRVRKDRPISPPANKETALVRKSKPIEGLPKTTFTMSPVLVHGSEKFLNTIHFYTSTCNLPLGVYYDYWWTLCLNDDTALTAADTLLKTHVGKLHPPTGSTHAFSQSVCKSRGQALRAVGRKLSTPEDRYSDKVLVAIGALAAQADVGRDEAGHRTHVNALRTIVDQRGGMESIDSQDLRALMITLDLNRACVENRAPHFKCALTLPKRREGPSLSWAAGAVSTEWRQAFPGHAPLIEIFDDALNSLACIKQPMSVVSVVGQVICNLHRLQSIFPVLHTLGSAHILKCAWLALNVAFLEPSRELGILNGSQPLFPSWLRTALEVETSDWDRLPNLRLWALTAGIKEARNEDDKMWFEWQALTAVRELPEEVQTELLRDMHNTFLDREVDSRRPLHTRLGDPRGLL